MGIAVEAPRGGLVEDIGGAEYPFLLRCGEIERFEDKHRGIFELWDGFFGRDRKPNAREVKDVLALGLVGAGMKPVDADKLIEGQGPDQYLHMYTVAQAVVGVAFMPDFEEDEGEEDIKKNKVQSQSD